MNITFLIGNGFDRNLGLKTAYSDFVKEYKGLPTNNEALQIFRKYVKENEELWSNAEIQLGQYTKEFECGEGAKLSDCQEDFCVHLAEYLKGQEARIDFSSCESLIVGAFSNLNRLYQSFPERERTVIDNVYQQHKSEQICFRFVCFNYTSTLDKCVNIVKKAGEIGSHRTGSGVMINHTITEVCHIHGTVNGEMVFAVNDETQIAKPEVFECENGDIYRALFIKKDANASYGENMDDKGSKLIQDSHIIYIYGMSIGDTDKLWWDRICKWLSGHPSRHLIVQKNSMPEKSVIPKEYQLAERAHRKLITSKSDLDENRKEQIEERIHVTAVNLFQDIRNIAQPTEEEQTAALQREYMDAFERTEKEKEALAEVAKLGELEEAYFKAVGETQGNLELGAYQV